VRVGSISMAETGGQRARSTTMIVHAKDRCDALLP
jgi:hypothetical protein